MTVTTGQNLSGHVIDNLDLEPIVYKLMHPEPGQTVMALASADQMVSDYRCFLKLCAWYPGEPIVPTKDIDEVWHSHILDTGKYAADSDAVFGHFVHHFPYFGLRGPADEANWQAAYARTRELFQHHFGIELPAGQAARGCHNNGSSCNVDGAICNFEAKCERRNADAPRTQERPRPDR